MSKRRKQTDCLRPLQMKLWVFSPLALAASAQAAQPSWPANPSIRNVGNVAAVEALIARVWERSGVARPSPFAFSLADDACQGQGVARPSPCFAVNARDGRVEVVGTTAAELAAGAGSYFRRAVIGRRRG